MNPYIKCQFLEPVLKSCGMTYGVLEDAICGDLNNVTVYKEV